MYDTGQFSKLARVSKRTLRYYDSLGLLTPTSTDPTTGTRQYSARQLADLNRIIALKEMGLSLSQIQPILADDISDDEIMGMLRLRRAEAEQAVVDERRRLRNIEARLSDPSTFLKGPGVVTKAVEAQRFLSYRSILSLDQLMEIAPTVMAGVPARLGSEQVAHYVSVLHGDSFDDDQMDVEFGYYLVEAGPDRLQLSADLVLTTSTLPALAQAATVIVVGGPTRYPAGLNEVGRWAETHEVRLGETQREVFLQLPEDGTEDDMVIELQLPILDNGSS